MGIDLPNLELHSKVGYHIRILSFASADGVLRVHISTLCLLVVVSLLPSLALGQFKTDAVDPRAPKLQPGLTQRLQVGVKVTASGGPCKGIVATVPVPLEWPEQQLKIVNEEISTTVKPIKYRITGGLRQMLVEIPQLPAGQEAKAILTFEVYRASTLPPDDTSVYSIPKKVDRDLIIYTGASPFIETRNVKIMSLAKEITAGKEAAWSQVEAIYDWVRTNVQHKNGGAMKGGARALADKEGDTDDVTSLFIALCRAHKVPARTVFVPGSVYAEFYLVDDQGNGHWFACQPVGARSFGGVTEQRPILQKGDNFRDPDRPGDSMRFVNEFMKGAAVKGGGQPKVRFIREVAGGGVQ